MNHGCKNGGPALHTLLSLTDLSVKYNNETYCCTYAIYQEINIL